MHGPSSASCGGGSDVRASIQGDGSRSSRARARGRRSVPDRVGRRPHPAWFAGVRLAIPVGEQPEHGAVRIVLSGAFFLAEAGTPGAIVEAGPTKQIFNAPEDERTSDYVHGRFG
jgi:hypothetical protein